MNEGIFDEKPDFDIIKGLNDAYVINDDMEVTAHIRGFQDVDTVNGFFYTSHNNVIYRVPVYDLKMLEEDYDRLAGQPD